MSLTPLNASGFPSRQVIAYIEDRSRHFYWLKWNGSLWRGISTSERSFSPGESVKVFGYVGNKLVFGEHDERSRYI